MDGCGALRDCRYLLHDRDTKYSLNTDRCRARGGSFPRFIERWLNNVLAPRATAGHYRRQRGLLY